MVDGQVVVIRKSFAVSKFRLLITIPPYKNRCPALDPFVCHHSCRRSAPFHQRGRGLAPLPSPAEEPTLFPSYTYVPLDTLSDITILHPHLHGLRDLPLVLSPGKDPPSFTTPHHSTILLFLLSIYLL